MNLSHFYTLTQKCNFPEDAAKELSTQAKRIKSDFENDFDAFVSLYFKNECNAKIMEDDASDVAGRLGISPYSLWMLTLIEASASVIPEYKNRGIGEDIYWATFTDLCYKLKECKNVYNVWGTFVPYWYRKFFTCDIIKLGRLEYENAEYDLDITYRSHGVTVERGTPVKKIHIPSSGEPFDCAARLDSYKKAYEFFKNEHNGKPIVFACNSWLLYPDYQNEFKVGSNISDFRKEFDVISKTDTETFTSGWIVFGNKCYDAPSTLPENTSMQRAFKKRSVEGKTFGNGYGVFLFDGENIIKK